MAAQFRAYVISADAETRTLYYGNSRARMNETRDAARNTLMICGATGIVQTYEYRAVIDIQVVENGVWSPMAKTFSWTEVTK